MRPVPACLTCLALLVVVAACEGEVARTPPPELHTVSDSGATTAGMVMTDNALESLYAAAESRGLPVPVPGVLARAGQWRMMLDTAGVDDRLTILYEVAVITLPDGPVEFTAPVNAFRQVEGRWTDISALAAPRLPAAVSAALTASLAAPDKVHVFRAESVDVSGSPEAVRTLPQRIERAFTRLEEEALQLRRDGFMPASMEP